MADVVTPRDGLPDLADTPAAIASAAERIAAGRGPVAVDTERASGYRYDDRAFLLQLRRAGSGTVLVDPMRNREHVRREFAPVLNHLEWVLHAAPSDLPALQLLGLSPTSVFDTELAGRLAGLPKVNLATMVHEILGYTLAKGHGAEDWSERPLPEAWLTYAALDVELLLDLAEAMTELLDHQGKLDIAEQEFTYIVSSHRRAPEPPTWRDVKGVGSLRDPEQLVTARHLIGVRDSLGRKQDTAVSRILPTKTLIELARTTPTEPGGVIATRGFPRRSRSRAPFWAREITTALDSDPRTWPERNQRTSGAPSRSAWAANYPESHAVLDLARSHVGELSEAVNIPVENLLKPSVLRDAVWSLTEDNALHSLDGVGAFLQDKGARPWQIEATAPLIWASRTAYPTTR